MLILTRRIGETFKVGDDVSVTVLGVRGSQIRIGISAPRAIDVYRKEIYDKRKSADKQSAENKKKTSNVTASH